MNDGLRVGEALEEARKTLAAARVPSPALEARLLLGHVLAMPHLEVGLARDRRLTAREARVFADLVRERARRRPLQHLVGDVEFHGRRFEVGPGVMIPRPETESVAEIGLSHLPRDAPARVAEIGCGAGVLAVTIAAERPLAAVWCSDIEPRALALTGRNAAALGVGERVHPVAGDLLAPLAPWAPFDLVITNPPYIPGPMIAELEPEVREHDPRLALDGGADGLDVVRRILATAAGALRPGGWLVVEIGDRQGAQAIALATEHGWLEAHVHPDLTGRDRILDATSAPRAAPR